MIAGALTLTALAAPVLDPGVAADGLDRCAADAEAAAGPRPAPPDDVAGPLDRVAIVVGVPCHRAESIPSLAYATRDAARVADVLSEGGFTVLPLLTVVDRADLFAALDRAQQLVSHDGTLVVYFSGHGVLREEGGTVRRYLVMSDTELSALSSTAVEVRSLEWRLDQVTAGSRVLVQDTCFASRAGGKSLGQPGAEGAKGLPVIEPPLRLRDGDLRLYASQFWEQAMESPELGGSIYTAHLLDAMRRVEADLDGDGCVGLIEAHRWSTARTSEARNGFQVPQLEGRSATNLVLGCAPGAPVRAVVGRTNEGDAQWVIRGRDGFVAHGDEPVPPGSYRIRLDHLAGKGDQLVPMKVLDTRTHLAAGEWYDLDREVARRAAFVAIEADVRATTWPQEGVPALGFTAWGSPRDHGVGRWIVGGTGRGWGSAGPLVETLELSGWGGWSWTRYGGSDVQLGLGPVVGAGSMYGAYLRGADATGWGPFGELGARGWIRHRRLVASAAIGGRLVVTSCDRSPEPLSPSKLCVQDAALLTLGIGAAL